MSASPESKSAVGHLAIVANPTSGHGAGQRVLGAATAVLRGRGVSHEVLTADTREQSAQPVSYTHLTLPTKRIV